MVDRYILGRSEPVTLPPGGREVRADLSLSPNPRLEAGCVFGKVTELDSPCRPVAGACVKLLDPLGDPVGHAFTDSCGLYELPDVAPDPAYRLIVIAPGYLLSDGVDFSMLPRQRVEVNVRLRRDPRRGRAVIAGKVSDAAGLPIGEVRVTLHPAQAPPYDPEPSDRAGVPAAGVAAGAEGGDAACAAVPLEATFSNADGQFVLSDVEPGSYVVSARALGFQPASLSVAVLGPSQVVQVELRLEVDPSSRRGTVSGKVCSSTGTPLAGAVVVLYRVGDAEETPVDSTLTNASGDYLFIGVEPGHYVVKSEVATHTSMPGG